MSDMFVPPQLLDKAEHGVVFRDDASFCGWPFFCGFWTTGAGDYLVAFQRKAADYSDSSDINHDQVARIGPKIVTIRSRDMGRTWDANSLQTLFDLGADQEKVFAGLPGDYRD